MDFYSSRIFVCSSRIDFEIVGWIFVVEGWIFGVVGWIFAVIG